MVTVLDGLIEQEKIVEIKCPCKFSKETMESLARLYEHFYLNITDYGCLKLKEDHDYHYQESLTFARENFVTLLYRHLQSSITKLSREINIFGMFSSDVS